MLFEAIFHFVSWRRLRKLVEKLKCGGELPQGEHRRFRTAGKLLCPLAVPAVLLFGLHLLVGGYQVGLNNNEPVYDLSSIPIPTLEDLGMESGDYYTYSAADVRHDLLADVIYDYYCDRYAHDEPVFDYRVQYYDMRSEKLAELLADGIIKDASHANEEPAPSGWVHCAVDKSFELDGAQLRIVCDLDTNRDKVQQTLCVVLGDRVMYVYYYGYDSIESYYTYDSIEAHAQDFVDCLK